MVGKRRTWLPPHPALSRKETCLVEQLLTNRNHKMNEQQEREEIQLQIEQLEERVAPGGLGSFGYEGQPRKQGNGLQGYESQPRDQGGGNHHP